MTLSRDILGKTHMIWHWKSGQVILDISFLRNRHKLPWALCCCLFLHCMSWCSPRRTVPPLCRARGSSAPGGLGAFSATQWEHRSSDVSVNLWAQSLEPELHHKTHDMATQENFSSVEELQDSSSSLAASQSGICTQSSWQNFCRQLTKTFFGFSA